MFISHNDVPSLFNRHPTTIPLLQLDKPSCFSLGMSGVAGLMGGDDALAAMVTVHVYGNRRWLGWYNTPGSFQIAKRLNALAKSVSISSRNSSSRPKNVQIDPRTLFDSHSSKGPKFRAAHSGTVIEETGYLAQLFMQECAAWESEGKVVPGRKTQPVRITIADLGHGPAPEMHPASSSAFTLFSTVPIATSIGACALCAVFGDCYASLLIFVGIIASGISCFVLGSADLTFTHPDPAKGSPPGDGILCSDKDIVLLRGSEGAVNSIMRGQFSLCFSNECQYKLVRSCSLLFFIQCITQLLLVPQASLFGQVVFLVSLGVSALHNAWLSSLDKEKIHRKILFERVLDNPRLTKYTLGTRTTAVVFMLLVLQLQDPTGLLNELLPNDTKVWKHWKAMILERLRRPQDKFFSSEGKFELGHLDRFTQQEQDLVELLYDDARVAYNGYRDYLQVDAL